MYFSKPHYHSARTIGNLLIHRSCLGLSLTVKQWDIHLMRRRREEEEKKKRREEKAIERKRRKKKKEEERVPVNNCKVKAIYKEQLQLVSINGYNGMSFHVMSTFCIIVTCPVALKIHIYPGGEVHLTVASPRLQLLMIFLFCFFGIICNLTSDLC